MKFDEERCEVCYEPLGESAEGLDPEIEAKIYRPREDGPVEEANVDFNRHTTYAHGDWELVEPDVEHQ